MPARIQRALILTLFIVLLVLPVSAQFGVEDVIVLQPFVLEDFDLQGLRPLGWTDNPASPGVFLRFRDPSDRTAIMIQSDLATPEELLVRLQTAFDLEAAPAVAAEIQANNLTWSVYEFSHGEGTTAQTAALAVARLEDRVYYVLIQTAQVFYDNLYANLFVPVVESITAIAYYEDPEERFRIPIPTAWTLEETETFAIFSSPDTAVRVIVSATSGTDAALAMTELWQQSVENFASEYAEADVRTVSDPAQTGGLDQVVIIDWDYGTEAEGLVRQGVTREYDGVLYMMLIEAPLTAIQEQSAAISIIDGGLRIHALSEAEVAATAEATETANP